MLERVPEEQDRLLAAAARAVREVLVREGGTKLRAVVREEALEHALPLDAKLLSTRMNSYSFVHTTKYVYSLTNRKKRLVLKCQNLS